MVTVAMSNGRFFIVNQNMNGVRTAIRTGVILHGRVPGGHEKEYRHHINPAQIVSYNLEEEVAELPTKRLLGADSRFLPKMEVDA